MSDRLPSVGVVLLNGNSTPTADQLSTLTSTAALRAVAGRVAAGAGGPFWEALGARILGALRNALEIPMGTVLVEAWSRYAAFREYLDPARYPADRISVVTLARHTARSSFKPVVELWIGGDCIAKLKVEAELAITLESGILSIQAGRFTELRPGKCTVAGAIRCEGATLLERPLTELTLPGVVTFGEGIPIGTRRETVAAGT